MIVVAVISAARMDDKDKNDTTDKGLFTGLMGYAAGHHGHGYGAYPPHGGYPPHPPPYPPHGGYPPQQYPPQYASPGGYPPSGYPPPGGYPPSAYPSHGGYPHPSSHHSGISLF